MAHDGTTMDSRRAALTLRYGDDAMPETGPWNDTISHLLAHRSIRAYKPDEVPEHTFESLVAAAQSAASSSNLQTWSVIAVRDPATKAKFARIAGNQRHIEQCPLFLVWLADLSRMQRLEQAEGIELPTLPYQETFLVAAIDAALAAQNAVIAAESLGLSTVYIGALRNDPIAVASELSLPSGAVAVFGMCVGYAADSAAAAEVKPRLPQAAIAFSERYVVPDEAAIRAGYDRRMAAFSARNEMKADSWTSRVKARMGKIAYMGGRDRLTDALKALGFPLR